MKAFVWSDRFVTGFATVDSQHQYLFELVNRVGTQLLNPDPAQPAEIEGVFKELATYANTHFKDEEHLMQTLGVDAEHQRHHVKTHRDFIEQVKSMWQQRTTMNAPAETLHGFLVAWLTYHILGEDQEMAREIVRIQGGMPPAEAHQLEHVRGERSTSALLQALQTLYGVLSRLNRDMAATNLKLEATVAERTAALTDANRALVEEQQELRLLLEKVNEVQSQLLQADKMASVGQLAAGVAHEINNPLGFVNSNLATLGRYAADLLQLAAVGAATPEGKALAQQVDFDFLREDLPTLLNESQDGLDRVHRIVANLKDFSRVDQAEWQEADLLEGLESTITVALHELKYKAEIVRELVPLPEVRCVPAQINQVLLNLLVNAAQAIKDHGTITVRNAVEGPWVWLEIADSGKGMDAETQRRIFEPFFTTKPVGEGTGLGLSLAWDIIKKHGGSIDVDSVPDQGTRMRLWLPIAGPPAATP